MRKYLKYGMEILLNNIYYIIKKCCLNKLCFSNPMLAGIGTYIHTDGKNAVISIAGKTGIRSNTEIYADNGEISIGYNSFINKNCMVIAHEKIIIGNNVTIGPNTVIYDHDHDIINGGYITSLVSILDGAWIGAGCIILKGVTIGKNSVIAAGTVVTKSIPDNTVLRMKIEYVKNNLDNNFVCN